MNNRFATAADIAGYLVDSPDVQKNVKREVQQSALITALMRLRLKKGITQTQVAEQLGCDPSKVSKLESGNDLALRVADVLGYLRAVGASMSLFVHDEELPAAERIKQYVFAIHDQLEKLAVIAKDECDDQHLAEKSTSSAERCFSISSLVSAVHSERSIRSSPWASRIRLAPRKGMAPAKPRGAARKTRQRSMA